VCVQSRGRSRRSLYRARVLYGKELLQGRIVQDSGLYRTTGCTGERGVQDRGGGGGGKTGHEVGGDGALPPACAANHGR
jgi:hypothetical protein